MKIGTALKIKLAKFLLFLVKIFYKNNIRIIKRNGINFEIDLEEGIDLHLFLFGGFQNHVYSNEVVKIKDDAVIFDVGGNIGLMSLFFAKQVKNGFVYAFEPTYYALKKFNRNLELNKKLAERIELAQYFIYSENSKNPDIKAFSSWKLTGNDDNKHKVHKGVVKSTKDVEAITIDYFVEAKGLKKLDLIKVDTDGYELQVLRGATKTMLNLKPQIIFEIGLYIMAEKNISYSDYVKLFSHVGYKIVNVKNKEITLENYKKYIPKNGTVDLIAVPSMII